MSLATIRAEYKKILEGIGPIKFGPGFFKFGDPGAAFLDGTMGNLVVGPVHDYERWSAEWKKFLDHFKASDGKIHGWTITREKTTESFIPGLGAERRHTMVLRGYYALQDSVGSEKNFQDLIEVICTVFRGETTLNGTVEQVEAPLQVDLVEPRMFGAVLCHYCELRQVVPETLTFTER